MSLGIAIEQALPFRLRRRTTLTRIPAGFDVRRDFKRRMRPANVLAGRRDFVIAQRCAVCRLGALLVGAAETDQRLALDQGRALGVFAGALQGQLDLFRVVPVDIADHLPAIGFEATTGVVGKPARHFTVDGNVVVIVKHDELAQPQRAGQRAGLVADAFHQATVTGENIGVVVNDVERVTVELGRHQALTQRHAHGIGQALPQRASGGFHARGDAEFRMARRLGVHLPEVFQLFHRQVIAAQMQQGIEQHGTVAVGDHETVAVRPAGIARVVLEVVVPQHLRHVGHTHRHAGVSGVGFLHRIHRQCANCVGQSGSGSH